MPARAAYDAAHLHKVLRERLDATVVVRHGPRYCPRRKLGAQQSVATPGRDWVFTRPDTSRSNLAAAKRENTVCVSSPGCCLGSPFERSKP